MDVYQGSKKNKHIKKTLMELYVTDLARKQRHNLRWAEHHLLGFDRKIIKSYLSHNPVKKLHIGCGYNILNDWLNSDYDPKSLSILQLDVRRHFPFERNTFNYVYSEHVIEHVTFSEGLHMLKECYRILKHNGKLRISTPDLSFLIELYENEKSDLQKKYIQWATDHFIEYAPYYDATFVINNFVRNWGHKFIYDKNVLCFSMEKAGFKKVTLCDLNQSEDDQLKNLENEGRMPPDYLKLESIILEGTKP